MERKQKLQVIPEEAFPQAILQVEEQLAKLCHQGFFIAQGDAEIYYEYFLAPNPVGSVVFVHGLSEFTKKYQEMALYFYQQGYNVFLYDQRSHGQSHRDAARPELIHVNSFDQLADDLETYVQTIVRPAWDGPLYLYAHSLGGAVGLLYLSKYGRKFQKAVITSPMLVPRMKDLPPWLFLMTTGVMKIFRGHLAKFLLSSEYKVGNAYVHIPGDSPNRVKHYLTYRDREIRYQSTPLTLGCVQNSLKIKRQLLSKKVTQAIPVPTLMLCADDDHLVRNKPQAEFAKRCPACTRELVPGANHAFHTDSSEILEQVLLRVFDFFRA